jgi:hypothetical protein
LHVFVIPFLKATNMGGDILIFVTIRSLSGAFKMHVLVYTAPSIDKLFFYPFFFWSLV